MIQFKPSRILLASEVIAEQLQDARQAKNLKLKDIAKELNIKEEYLRALEKGEYNKLPAGIYGKNFLKEYAFYLGLDYKKLLKDWQEEKNIGQSVRKKEIFSKQVIKKHNFLVIPKIIRSIIIIIIVLICFFYLGFYLKGVISSPKIYIIEPQDNLITNNNFVVVLGLTEPETQVIINEELILSDSDGLFTKRVNLKSGINTIIIVVRKKYGRERTIKRQILVKE